ncbi:unnamed protein product [Spirodela intermedia]|uniref:Uncharacterized protein n=1 Tax=Spirodela intermedia TaxID=51605 RepID=A0A7I8IBS0_SPIIN|nr:unnamed protein product [Spirodela intermedia]CAA6654794.1 unnamed protein product [Spirodela intermedia]
MMFSHNFATTNGPMGASRGREWQIRKFSDSDANIER